MWGNTIVDGHNRYEICTRLDIPFKTSEKFFAGADEAVEWIIKNQFGRRNLSLMDRSRFGLRLEEVYRQRAKANQGTRIDIHQKSDKSPVPVKTLKEIDKIAGVSHDTIHKAKAIEVKATPLLIET